MSYMFCGCSKLTNLDLYSFDTKNVNNMSLMFSDCSNLNIVKINDNLKNIIKELTHTNANIIDQFGNNITKNDYDINEYNNNLNNFNNYLMNNNNNNMINNIYNNMNMNNINMNNNMHNNMMNMMYNNMMNMMNNNMNNNMMNNNIYNK